ncbi:MAG: serine acetyltransferase [Muribaculaceae bacterium]|nr:serine acetyltransferase [Muribaculaceae bacterium]
MDKRKIRDYGKLCVSILFVALYIPHLLMLILGKKKKLIFTDVNRIGKSIKINCGKWFKLIFLLHTNAYYRSLFYHRLGPVKSLFISWYRPGDRYFILPYSTLIGEGFMFYHPFSTILNAEKIGNNFSCGHSTTIGATGRGRPSIGDNVALGVGVIIIGKIKIGNNVTVGAGTVITKNIPDNTVVVGNPVRIIKTL